MCRFFHVCKDKKEKKGKHSKNDYSDSPVIEVPQAVSEGGNKTEDKDHNEQEVLEENTSVNSEVVTAEHHPLIGVHNLRPREDPMWEEVKT